MNRFFLNFLIVFLLATVFSSCRVFNPSRMFETDHDILVDSIQRQMANAEENYTLQKDDYLTLQVFSNGGERIIDPDFELRQQAGQKQFDPPRYLVRADGYVKFPMVGDVNVSGLTLYQTDSLLAVEYSKYYEGAFVVTKLLNRRVVVFGPDGGKVIPLENENINLIEVIAAYGGMSENGKAYNIRLIRGDLNNPNVSIVDLSTIEGMKKASLNIQPDDIIYIETQRKLLSESLREIAPLISLISSILVTIFIITRSN